jgi:hypothetical protein
MNDVHDLAFVIPTCCSSAAGQTVVEYDEHFWRNRHAVRPMVFAAVRAHGDSPESLGADEASRGRLHEPRHLILASTSR